MSKQASEIYNQNLDRNGICTAAKLVELVADEPEAVERRKMNAATPGIEEARQKFNAATDAMMAASDRMNRAFADTKEKATTAISRAKDQANQVSDAMNRITKMLGPDFEKRLAQLVTLTDCLERLAALDKAGKLDPLLKALR